MYPKPIQDLYGWNILDIGCGYSSIVVSADESVISWGPTPTYGELVSPIIFSRLHGLLMGVVNLLLNCEIL